MPNQAEDAYRTATYIAKLYAKLDVARDIINNALDETPTSFDQNQFDRILDIRDKLNREIGLIFDLSKREAHRICNTTVPEFEMLTDGQIIQADDEWFNGREWQPTCGGIGRPFDSSLYVPHRRRVNPPTPQLIWKENETPDQPGLWAFRNHDGDIFYHDVSKLPKHMSWSSRGHWCFLGPVPDIKLEPKTAEPTSTVEPTDTVEPTPADDQNGTLSHSDFLPSLEQIPSPDPNFIHVSPLDLPKLTRNLPTGGLGGV